MVLGSLVVGDDTRDGVVNGEDIELELGWYLPAVRANPSATPPVMAAPAKFVGTRALQSGAFAGINTANDGLYLDRGLIPNLQEGDSIPTVDRPAAENNVEYVPALRIGFDSAGENALTYPSDYRVETLQDKSRVEVSSTSDRSSIRISVSEKNLATYAALDNGVGAANFGGTDITSFDPAAADSRDSGVFVGRFGVIRKEFKDAIADYAGLVPTPQAQAQTITVVSPAVNTAETPDDPNTIAAAPSAVFNLTGVSAANTLVSGSLEVMFKPGVDTDGSVRTTMANDHVVTVNSDGTVTVAVPLNGSSVAEDGNEATADTADMFMVNYTTEAASGTIASLLATVQATGTADQGDDEIDGVFNSFCGDDDMADRDKNCMQAVSLVDAINGHTGNLGLMGARVDALLAAVIGVEHGDTVTIRYGDAEPTGTRTARTEVDIVAPAIGGNSLASGSYVADDDFSFFFNVTDADSGIPEDAHEEEIRDGHYHVMRMAMYGQGEDEPVLDLDGGDTAELDVDDEITDGERYEIEFDVTSAVQTAEGTGDDEPETVTVKVDITAYDLARNVAKKSYTFVVDDIDPELMKALTGVSVKAGSDGDPYELVTENTKGIVLVFDDAIAGADVNAQNVSVSGNSVTSVTWLDNTNGSKIGSVGGVAVRDDLGLADDMADGEDARHLLFLTLENDLATDARPTIDIDNGDLRDLAGNESRNDHTAKPVDELAPVFTVTVANPLSNDELEITIVASEELEQTPKARLMLGSYDEPLSVRAASDDNTWTVSTNRKAENLGGTSASGKYTVHVTGTDTNDNDGMSMKSTWELDTKANGGMPPARVYDKDADPMVAQPIEVNDVVFLNFEFAAEANEYGTGTGDEYKSTDTKKMVTVTGLGLEGLSAGSLDSDDMLKAAAMVEVTETWEVEDGSAQSSNHVRYVVALSDLAIGNYRLNVDFVDEAGNEGKFGYVFKITAPAPASVAVNPGWSLISIPGTPQDKSIDGVLEGSMVTDVWSLNNETKIWEFARKDADSGEWMGTLTQIVDGRGYFVRSTTFDPVKVLTERFSPQRTPSQYTVTAGWNSIGYTPAGNETMVPVDAYLSALGNSGWGMIRMWNSAATPPQYETYFSNGTATDGFTMDEHRAVVEKGKGYLLFATRDGVIGG